MVNLLLALVLLKEYMYQKIDLYKFCKSEKIEKNIWEMQFSMKKVFEK